MRRWRAGLLVMVLMLGLAPEAGAEAPYAGSARVTPFLVSAHVQLAMNQVRQAQHHLEAGPRETVAANLGPVRQALADAAEELALARLATADPDQIQAIDAMLARLDHVRDLLGRQVLGAPAAMRRLEQDMLALHRTARSQIAMREEAVVREDAPRPAIR